MAILITWFLIQTAYMISDGLCDKGFTADIAVILGSKMNEDGTLSVRLKKRLDTGIELYKSHRVKKNLVSGGLGREGFYEGSEMKKFLITKGIPDSLILLDHKGNNTGLTVENTLKLQKKYGFKSIIAVSQYFHVTRTKKLFRENGISSVSSVSPAYFEWRDIYSVIREFPAYYLQ